MDLNGLILFRFRFHVQTSLQQPYATQPQDAVPAGAAQDPAMGQP